jgi:CRP-like cAMP-binding protein
MKIVNFCKGAQVFEQGVYGEEAYRIVEGAVEISIKEDGSKVVLAKLVEGEVFGEMGMIERRPRSAAAYALGDLKLEVITEDDFNLLLSQGGEPLVPFLTTIFERLRVTNERLRAALEELGQTEKTPHDASFKRIRKVGVRGFTVRLEPDSGETLAQSSLKERELLEYPFLLGRRADLAGVDVFAKNHLLIGDTAPYRISRNHCAIERKDGAFFVIDRGSMLGTIVNGICLGGQSREKSTRLSPGRNSLILGGPDSSIRFAVVVPEAV